MDRRTDGLTDDQREPIIPRHYCVARYKNVILSPLKGYHMLEWKISPPKTKFSNSSLNHF